MPIPKAGPEEVLKMLQQMNEADREVLLSNLEKKDAALVGFLRENLIRFEDLIYITQKMLVELLREVPIEKLALALRGSPKELVDHLIDNLSSGLANEIMYIYNGAPQSLSKVQEARNDIMKVVRVKVEKGELILNPKSSEEMV